MGDIGGAAVDQRDQFEKWLDERYKWLQTAASRLISKHKKPTPAEISDLADLCIAEATNVPGTKFEQVPSGAFGSGAAGMTMKVLRVEQVNGVNAIKPGASLDFGTSNLVIVYGLNGAGKSGFSRLLKSVCGARLKQEIHPNVFSDAAPAASADITASIDGADQTFRWSIAGGPVPRLRNVQVFDTLTANSYVQTKSEASYEPRRMRFLSALIEIADLVAAELGRRKAELPSKLPVMPPDYMATESHRFLKALIPSLPQANVDNACRWSAEDDQQRLNIENALKQGDVQARLKALTTEKNRLSILTKLASDINGGLSDAKVSAIVSTRLEAAAKRKAASVDAEKVFATSALEGVGQDSWKMMWEQARAYSEALAYPEKAFPFVEDGSRCVLCHQPLDVDAKSRMADFEAFVKGGLEVAATAAELRLMMQIGHLPAQPDPEQWTVDMEFLKVDSEAGSGLLSAIANRLEAVKTATACEQVPPLTLDPVHAAITSLEAALAKEEGVLTELQKDGKRQELETQLKELKAREWLSQQKASVEAEIARLKAVQAIEAAEKLAKTNALTQKNNDLARDELANGYCERFAAELETLGGKNIPAKPVAISEGKGKTSFQLTLNGAKRKVPAPAVLSEGESRVVALAAFIADMLGSGHPTPFVFDDPISSLDQDFEERVVDRLVALSKSRQVIVFTHRLSLMTLLEDAVKKQNDFAAAHGSKVDMPTVICLRRFGDVVGVTEDISARNYKKPEAGFRALRDRLPRIRKYIESGLVDEYEFAVKAVCSDFRILIERSIESSLLSNVVARFRRSVNTLQIRYLAKIRAGDCAFIDGLMTRYSRYEHSQSGEAPVALPKPDELAKDIDDVLAWIQDFDNRAVA